MRLTSTNSFLYQAALLVFLSAAARARIVAADLEPLGEVLITRPAGPAHRPYMIAWCRRGTALSQAHGDFHILDVAGDREINGLAPERTTYHLDSLDCLEID